jgi:protein Tob/BTG
MKLELQSASNFLVHLVRLGRRNINETQLEKFRNALMDALRRRYRDHWFPEKPFKGSGYRCIRINGKMDPVISQAGEGCGLSPQLIHSIFPSELTMWIDPLEVSYRIGENGSICVLYEFKEGAGEPWRPCQGTNGVSSLNNKSNNSSPSKTKNDNEAASPTPTTTLPASVVVSSTPCKDSLRKMDYILDPRKSLSSIDQLAAYVSS